MSYRKHAVSKLARKAHRKRAQKRKAKFGGLAAFVFEDMRGRDWRQLSPTRNGDKLR